MFRPEWHRPCAVWMVLAFLAPLVIAVIVAVLSGAVSGIAIAILAGFLAVQVLRISVGKYFGLFLACLGWLFFFVLIANLLTQWIPAWVVVILLGIFAFAMMGIACRIAMPWGHMRMARLSASGKPIREWEWIYTGREFALSHPLATLGPGILLTFGYVAVIWILLSYGVYFAPAGFGAWVVFFMFSVLVGFTLTLLVRRHPAAWVLVWICLVITFPLSIPLMFYWADGVRPNLIYRHRFERLAPIGTTGGANV